MRDGHDLTFLGQDRLQDLHGGVGESVEDEASRSVALGKENSRSQEGQGRQMSAGHRREGDGPSAEECRQFLLQELVRLDREPGTGAAEVNAPLVQRPFGPGNQVGMSVQAQVGAVDEFGDGWKAGERHRLLLPGTDGDLHHSGLHRRLKVGGRLLYHLPSIAHLSSFSPDFWGNILPFLRPGAGKSQIVTIRARLGYSMSKGLRKTRKNPRFRGEGCAQFL